MAQQLTVLNALAENCSSVPIAQGIHHHLYCPWFPQHCTRVYILTCTHIYIQLKAILKKIGRFVSDNENSAGIILKTAVCIAIWGNPETPR